MKIFILILILVIVVGTVLYFYSDTMNKSQIYLDCVNKTCSEEYKNLTTNCDLSKIPNYDDYKKCRDIFDPPVQKCKKLCKKNVKCLFC
jgi:hypothetical protein